MNKCKYHVIGDYVNSLESRAAARSEAVLGHKSDGFQLGYILSSMNNMLSVLDLTEEQMEKLYRETQYMKVLDNCN